jgi:hypothetical protein
MPFCRKNKKRRASVFKLAAIGCKFLIIRAGGYKNQNEKNMAEILTPLEQAINRINAQVKSDTTWWDQLAPILLLMCQAQASAGPSVQTVSITLTRAQIENLGDTPVIAIPQAPAGQANILLGGFVNYQFGTSPYQNLSDIQLSYAISGTPVCIFSLSFTPSVTNNTSVLNIGGDFTGSEILIANDAVIISAPGNTPTGGDGSFTFCLAYTVGNLPVLE